MFSYHTIADLKRFQTLGERDMEIKRLRAALKALVDVDEAAEESDLNGGDIEEEDGSPVWDKADEIFRCSQCSYEIYRGYCQGPHCDAYYEMEDLSASEGVRRYISFAHVTLSS